MTSGNVWTRALKDFLDDPSLSEEERVSLHSCSEEKVRTDLAALVDPNLDRSKLRRCMQSMEPLFSGLERFGKAVDVFGNAERLGILSLCWGSVRMVLVVGPENRSLY